MMGKKSEKKKGHMGVKLAMSAITVAGVVGMVKGGKRWVVDKYHRMLAKKNRNVQKTEEQSG